MKKIGIILVLAWAGAAFGQPTIVPEMQVCEYCGSSSGIQSFIILPDSMEP